MGVVGAFAGSKLRLGLKVVHILNPVLDEERLGESRQLQMAHAPVHLRKHRLKQWIFFRIGASLLRSSGARGSEGYRKKTSTSEDCD
jgi:hypothetical protein